MTDEHMPCIGGGRRLATVDTLRRSPIARQQLATREPERIVVPVVRVPRFTVAEHDAWRQRPRFGGGPSSSRRAGRAALPFASPRAMGQLADQPMGQAPRLGADHVSCRLTASRSAAGRMVPSWSKCPPPSVSRHCPSGSPIITGTSFRFPLASGPLPSAAAATRRPGRFATVPTNPAVSGPLTSCEAEVWLSGLCGLGKGCYRRKVFP